MSPRPLPRITTATAGLAAVGLLLGGCLLPGGSSSDPTSSAPPASGAIGSIEEAKGAIVRIVAEGSYVDPAEGLVSAAGSGSGFVISPDGLVVTNAHVVEGAGSIQAYVGGATEPVNAQILGVSECNDLAVIKLSGSDYPYVDWHQGPADPGLEVYAAGFPLGDPEYTLVKGIVAKARADGDTPWASLEYAIQHDAEFQPGNSGGPLLTSDAKVVGVNYAYSDPTNTSQYFAIPGSIAQETVAVLETGEDVDSIGINGFALYNDADGVGGLWVSGIRAGSPASNAGIEPGDILLTLAGRDVVQASDNATKAGYCDVLRTQGTDSPMAAEVYRPGSDEVLSGEINNPAKPLTVVPTAGGGGGSSGGEGFTTATDPTGRLTVDLPTAWSDIDTDTLDTNLGTAGYLSASPNQDDFLAAARGTAGVLYIVHEDLGPGDLITARDEYASILTLPEDCTAVSSVDVPTEFEDYAYVATDYENCGDSGLSAYIASLWYPTAGVLVTVAGAYGTTEEQDLLNGSIGSMVVS